MKAWLFGKEIPYFKPLRNELDKGILEKIELSEQLVKNGWTKKEVIGLITRNGFLDPNYENYIRAADYLINMQHFTVEGINSIHNPVKKVSERIPIFFNDFIKNNTLNITHKLKSKGVLDSWVIEDLNVDGSFVGKDNGYYIFETKYFLYSISEDYQLDYITYKETDKIIEHFNWTDSGVILKLSNNKTITLENDYTEWLSFIMKYNNYTWSITNKLPNKVDDLLDNINIKWVIHPNIWETLNVGNIEDRDFFISLFKEDWKNNTYIVKNKNKSCEMSGWRFYYVWDGFVLKDILTPNKERIKTVDIQGNIILNDTFTTDLSKKGPTKITDLHEGHLMKMLPVNSLNKLELHPHAVQRYEQRIDSKTYLCTMLDEISYQVYNFGYVVEGAHTSDRRKVETKRYGYVLSDELVISVWDKYNHRVKRRKRRKSKNMRNLDRISKIFSQLE